MARLARDNPEIVSAETFNTMFIFLFAYLKKTMFLPGQIDQWVTICDMNGLSMTSLPRKQLLGFGNLCQANLMYYLFRSIYTNVGWGQRLIYRGVQMFIDPETKFKIVLAADSAPQEIVESFHPMNLEKRFGGAADTPTNFWPPHMHRECCPPEELSTIHANSFIPENAYD